MSAISYAEMRRILGLPAVSGRPPAPWSVRKIRTGADAGSWGLWRRADTTPPSRTPIGAFGTWREAMNHLDGRTH